MTEVGSTLLANALFERGYSIMTVDLEKAIGGCLFCRFFFLIDYLFVVVLHFLLSLVVSDVPSVILFSTLVRFRSILSNQVLEAIFFSSALANSYELSSNLP